MFKRKKDQIIKRGRQTKILATLGPSTTSLEMIEKAFLAGVDNFRLNFSHGSHEEHHQRLKNIRAIEKKYQHPIGVVADLQGPKLRLGKFKEGRIDVKIGHQIRFDLDDALGDEKRVQIPHPEIIKALDVDQKILIDDGKVRVRIVKKGKDYVVGEIEAGQKLMDRKGVNIPGAVLDISALTAKDRKDLKFALSIDVDWVALSFVQKPEDVIEAKKIIKGKAAIMAKIEKPSAVESFDAILAEADGIMLARGDLGVEIPAEKVPVVQKSVVKKVRRAGKPLVIATQMLESMITSPTPTRAEASDVATAVYDGADAVMLSAETAAGDYPIDAITIMDRIAKSVEGDSSYPAIMDADHPEAKETDADAISLAAHHVAGTIGAQLIVNYTSSGSTALRTARQRPLIRILSLTPNQKTARRLAISYGVRSIVTSDISQFSQIVTKATKICVEYKLIEKGQSMVVTAGVPFGVSGSTNILRIARI